jgi:putative copper export protein
MTLYELLLFVHVLAAATWVGGAVMLKVQSARAMRSGPDRAAELALETEHVGTRVLMPASIVLLVAGLWMVFERISTLSSLDLALLVAAVFVMTVKPG